jgi:hypothetical protein
MEKNHKKDNLFLVKLKYHNDVKKLIDLYAGIKREKEIDYLERYFNKTLELYFLKISSNKSKTKKYL